jgi:prevent-host-death family protein
MDELPRIVPVTDVRRDIARLIEEVNRSTRAVFISQRGYLTAVLMSCDRYEALRLEPNGSQRPRRSGRLRRDEPVARTHYGPYDFETAQLLGLAGYATDLDDIPEEWMPDA